MAALAWMRETAAHWSRTWAFTRTRCLATRTASNSRITHSKIFLTRLEIPVPRFKLPPVYLAPSSQSATVETVGDTLWCPLTLYLSWRSTTTLISHSSRLPRPLRLRLLQTSQCLSKSLLILPVLSSLISLLPLHQQLLSLIATRFQPLRSRIRDTQVNYFSRTNISIRRGFQIMFFIRKTNLGLKRTLSRRFTREKKKIVERVITSQLRLTTLLAPSSPSPTKRAFLQLMDSMARILPPLCKSPLVQPRIVLPENLKLIQRITLLARVSSSHQIQGSLWKFWRTKRKNFWTWWRQLREESNLSSALTNPQRMWKNLTSSLRAGWATVIFYSFWGNTPGLTS